MPMELDERALDLKEMGVGGKVTMFVEYLEEYPDELTDAT